MAEQYGYVPESGGPMKKETPEFGTLRGPGYHRMVRQMGEQKYASLCEDTVRMQEEMRAKISGEYVSAQRDRSSYSTYPVPKRRKK